MAAPRLEFWFEFASTDSYLAAARIEERARSAGVSVVFLAAGELFWGNDRLEQALAWSLDSARADR